MKKILFVVNYLPGGGLEQVLVDTIMALNQKANLHILCIYKSNSRYLNDIVKTCKVSFLDSFRHSFDMPLIKSIYSRLYDKKCFQQLLFNRFIKNHSQDILVAFAEGWSLEVVAKSPEPKSKKIAWIHTDFTKNNCVIKRQNHYQYLFDKFNKTVFVSNTLLKEFSSIFRLNSPIVIPNGIDKDRIVSLSKEATNIILPKDRINFVSVGRLSFEKGFDRLISSFAKLDSSLRQRCHLLIIGNGHEKNNLQRMIDNNDLGGTILLTGKLDNPFPVIAHSHFMLAASRYEGFGLAILESMTLGIPVIATKTAGFSEILNNGEYGIILENNDNAFDEILQRLINKPKMMDNFHKMLLDRANFYSLHKFNQNILKVFNNE